MPGFAGAGDPLPAPAASASDPKRSPVGCSVVGASHRGGGFGGAPVGPVEQPVEQGRSDRVAFSDHFLESARSQYGSLV